MPEPRAFYRSYDDNGQRAGQVKRLHVMREDGKFPGRQGWCGTQAGDVQNSRAVVLNALPFVPPDGLTWCGNCVIVLARRALRDDPGPINDIDATGECCCNGCIGEGPCDLELGRGTGDDDTNEDGDDRG